MEDRGPEITCIEELAPEGVMDVKAFSAVINTTDKGVWPRWLKFSRA
jgi:hypothetical protein